MHAPNSSSSSSHQGLKFFSAKTN